MKEEKYPNETRVYDILLCLCDGKKPKKGFASLVRSKSKYWSEYGNTISGSNISIGRLCKRLINSRHLFLDRDENYSLGYHGKSVLRYLDFRNKYKKRLDP